MPISVAWGSKIISVPQDYLTLVGGTLYQLDVEQFFRDLRALEQSEAGIAHADIIRHGTEVVLSGVTYARAVEVINGYTVTFEDGQYRVRLTGANNNLADVANLNQVSIVVQNSAGLVISGSGVTQQDKTDIIGGVWADQAGVQVVAALDAPVTSRAEPGDAMALTPTERLATADAFLDRDMGAGVDTGQNVPGGRRTVRQALRGIRNKVVRAAVNGLMTIYKENDTTPDWTAAQTTDAAAKPPTTLDPT